MRLPRDMSGAELAKLLQKLGYQSTRQTGSHIRLTTSDLPGQHHITVPNHDHLRVGTLAAILSDVASHFQMSKENLMNKLFNP
jgi:predicted RNA binding protein YcfA (HicA-like mRNA interferase family)